MIHIKIILGCMQDTDDAWCNSGYMQNDASLGYMQIYKWCKPGCMQLALINLKMLQAHDSDIYHSYDM